MNCGRRCLPNAGQRIKVEADDLHRECVLSQIRKQVGFTQVEIAKRLGISQPTYAECERGSNMRIGTLQKIVAALGGELSFHVAIDGCDYNLQMPQMAMVDPALPHDMASVRESIAQHMGD